jgi:diguanylate cyclase (GGDEF)-like protein
VELAAILRESAREIDRLGRYGGEEFMVLLPDTDLDEGATFVDRVRERVAEHAFPIDDDHTINMTISAGVAAYPHPAVRSPEALVRMADDALYAAKEGGRDRVVRFDEMDLDEPRLDAG